jgi:hypothetical protein
MPNLTSLLQEFYEKENTAGYICIYAKKKKKKYSDQ